MNFNICFIAINSVNIVAYADFIKSLHASLEDLGFKCSINTNKLLANHINILVGATIFGSRYLNLEKELQNKPFILYQTEILSDQYGILHEWPEYLSLIASAQQIWDYSIHSTEFLRGKGLTNLHYTSPGHHKTMEEFMPQDKQDIDVLFYGTAQKRRLKIIDDLEKIGLKVLNLRNSSGNERNNYIARSKVILNIHSFDNLPALETIRISYLLANKNFVLSEISDHNPYGPGVIFENYNSLVDACQYYVRESNSRKKVSYLGYEEIKSLDFARILSKTIEQSNIENAILN